MSKGSALLAFALSITGCSNDYSNALQDDHGLNTSAQKALFCSEAFLVSSLKHEELAKRANGQSPRIALDHKLISKDFLLIFKNSPNTEQQIARSNTLKSHLISNKHPLVEINELTEKCASYAQSIGYSMEANSISQYQRISFF